MEAPFACFRGLCPTLREWRGPVRVASWAGPDRAARLRLRGGTEFSRPASPAAPLSIIPNSNSYIAICNISQELDFPLFQRLASENPFSLGLSCHTARQGGLTLQTDSMHEFNPESQTPAPWSRSDRKRMFIFLAIAFAAPLPVVIALSRTGNGGDSVLTVQKDLPLRAVTAFCALLATWTVARVEKRALGDYGIPSRQAFGWRFWEGAFWGFAMLSAVLLPLRVAGNFRLDSAALSGGAALLGVSPGA